MARKTRRPPASTYQTLEVLTKECAGCGRTTTIDYYNYRTITTLQGVDRFRLQVRRCHNRVCALYRRPLRPEVEGRLALPHHEFSLGILAFVGGLRYCELRSVPEIHQALTRMGVVLAQRTVTNLLDRYDELRALAVADIDRLGPALKANGRVVLAIDGLQPDVGHEVLWVIRDCLSGEVLLARSLLSSACDDLAGLLGEVKGRLDALGVPVAGVVSDGQHPIRNAVAKCLPSTPHQLCQFHYLREAARPIFEADRHAKKELKKRVRGVRAIERKAEGRNDAQAEVIGGYCAAVRSALTDDGRPPLDSAGLVLEGRLRAVAASLDRLAAKRELPKELSRLRELLHKGLDGTAEMWPEVREGYKWVYRVAGLLSNHGKHSGAQVRLRLRNQLGRMEAEASRLEGRGEAERAKRLRHFVKVSRSYEPGLFHCYDVKDVPRTNNDLEQLFGSHRYHERRTTGRKAASPGLVVRGQVRLVASLATRLRRVTGEELAPKRPEELAKLRAELSRRRHARVCQRRFRKDPKAYLKNLEKLALKSGLPS
jgi:hypothetical protein